VSIDEEATCTEDVFIWSRRQAALLRELARTGVALPNELDLPNDNLVSTALVPRLERPDGRA
jgi:hypothetical protein